jgi:hypothetical protein
MFHLYTDGDYYITINKKNLKVRRTKNIAKANYWTDLRSAQTWRMIIYRAYPTAKLEEFILTKKTI